jgi:hypothetical protein
MLELDSCVTHIKCDGGYLICIGVPLNQKNKNKKGCVGVSYCLDLRTSRCINVFEHATSGIEIQTHLTSIRIPNKM